MIRADGCRPRKRGTPLRVERKKICVVAHQPLRAPRANRVFRVDEKRIRTENTVIDKSNSGAVFATMRAGGFSPAQVLAASTCRIAYCPLSMGQSASAPRAATIWPRRLCQ
jgi:hypothetical protein